MAIFDGASNGERHQSNGHIMPYLMVKWGMKRLHSETNPRGSAKTLYMAGCFCFVMQWSQQNIASKSAVESSVDDKRFRNSQKVTHQIIRFAWICSISNHFYHGLNLSICWWHFFQHFGKFKAAPLHDHRPWH